MVRLLPAVRGPAWTSDQFHWRDADC